MIAVYSMSITNEPCILFAKIDIKNKNKFIEKKKTNYRRVILSEN